jgi:apoptosis-inducing factor 2
MKQQLVIIGGGYTSLDLFQKVKHKFDVKIIEPRVEFYHYIGMLRGVVDVEFNKTLSHSYQQFGDIVVCDSTQSIDFPKKFVVCESGKHYAFDVLVIASGVQHTIRTVPNLADSIESANTIVLQGGGPIGIELAGEICTKYPNKTLLISHPDHLLLSSQYRISFRNILTKLVLNNHISIISPEESKIVGADLIIPCFGFIPNNSFVPTKMLSEKGYVKVDEFLAANGLTNVFAMGDIADVQEGKTLLNGFEHSKILAHNLLHLTQKPYRRVKNDLTAIPFGPSLGYTFLPYFGGIILGGWFTSIVKGKRLLRRRISTIFR